MASHPFRTVRPTGSPSAGGSIHTLGAHLADNTPHPQFVKKGEEVGGGNISAHEANPSAHTRYYLSRNELCLSTEEFAKYLDENGADKIPSATNYDPQKIGKYVVTPYVLMLALKTPEILSGAFGQLLNRTDIIINENGDAQPLDGTDDRVPAYSMFDSLSLIVAKMLYGVALAPDSILYSRTRGKEAKDNILSAVFSRIGHTHDNLYALKEHTHSFSDIVNEDGVNPAPANHTHPEYVTFDDLSESELTRENLREVGIYEQAVRTPSTYNNNEFDLNRYSTQGNYTFAISREDINGVNGDAIRAGHYPEIYISAITDGGGLSSERTANEIDALDTSAILSVTSVQSELIKFGQDDITSHIQTGEESSQFKTVLQILSTNSPVKRNAYSSNLTDSVITYKDLTRKLYSRTGYSLDYAKYISSVIRTVFNNKLKLTPESFFNVGDDESPIAYIASRVNLVLANANEVPDGFAIGHIKYNYVAPYDDARIRMPPEFVDIFCSGTNVPVFSKDTGFSTSLNNRILSRDASGWILDGYYKRVVGASEQVANDDIISATSTATAMMPILGNLYVPYLNYFTTMYVYTALTNVSGGVVTNVAYFENVEGSTEYNRLTFLLDSSDTVKEDTGDAQGSGSYKSSTDENGVTSYPPDTFSTNDPYLYEFRKVITDNYTGIKFTDRSKYGHSPIYAKISSSTDELPDTFVEVYGTPGSEIFTHLATGTSSTNKTYKWNAETKAFELFTGSTTDDKCYRYNGTNEVGSTIELFSRCYVTDSNSAFKWNKVLLDRSEPHYADNNYKVYVYDLDLHRFIDITHEVIQRYNGLVPPQGSVEFTNFYKGVKLYTDKAIYTRSPTFGTIDPEDDQYVLPKILHSTPALPGVEYVKFTGNDISKFNTAPDYATGFSSGQKSFIQCSEEVRNALIADLGSVDVPTNVINVRAYSPDKLEYIDEVTAYDESLTYLRKTTNGQFEEITNLDEIVDSNGNLIAAAIADVYTMPKSDEETTYVIAGTILAGGGEYGIKLKRYAHHLAEISTDIYTKALFYRSPDTSLRENKKYYRKYTSSEGVDTFDELTSDADMDQAVADNNVYESLTMEDFFDIWCAIRQLTTVGATSTAATATGSDPLVYSFDSNGDLVTWDDWQELVTHGDPSFAVFESRTDKFLRLTDELLPKLNLVETALDCGIDFNGFGYTLKWSGETSPVSGRRYYTKVGNTYVDAGIGGSTLTSFEPGVNYYLNKYDTALSVVFKHAKWLKDLSLTTANLLVNITSVANPIIDSYPTIKYTTDDTSGITIGEIDVASSSTTPARLSWLPTTGEARSSIPNLTDLDKYATGKWVLSIQQRVKDLEDSDPTRHSYAITNDSIPVNGRVYYVKSGSNYSIAGIGQETLMSFSQGITYYVSTSLSARMAELEAIWEWFENNVRSGGGSLVVNATTTDVCIDAFLNYDSRGNAITRGTVVNLNPRSPGYILVPTSEIDNGTVHVDTNLAGDVTGGYTKVKVIDVDENGYAPYQFSVILKCDDNVAGSQNKVIENPIAEVLIPDASHPGEYQGAMYVPASSLLWTVTSGTDQGIWFKVPQSWVDLYNLGTNNSTYHVYLRKRFYGTSMTVGIARANKLMINRAGQ